MQIKSHIQSSSRKLAQWLKLILLSSFMLWANTTNSTNTASQPKPAYYRYYDSKGVVTISRNVSPDHIRHGYEVLDRNMYLINKVPPYNTQKDLSEENIRAAKQRENQKDLQIKRSYRNVKYATDKKMDAAKIIQKQISENYLRMKQLQSDRADFLTQKADLIFNKKAIPSALQQKLDNNEAHIKQTRRNIEMLKNQLAQQEAFFGDIISRLQKME